ISSPYPPTIPLPIPFTPSLLSPLFSPTLQPHTPNYLSIYPSTFQPNPTFRLTHLSPSHPLSTSPHHIPMLPYFSSLLRSPGSHSSETLFAQSPIVSPNHPPPYLILTIFLTCLQVKISSLTHTYPHSYPQVIHISTFSPLTLILSIIPLKPLLSLSYC